MRSDEALASIARAESHTTPKLMTPVHIIRLPLKREHKRHADAPPEPLDGRPRPIDHCTHERYIAPASGKTHNVVEELLCGVWLDIDARRECLRDVVDEREEVREARVCGPVRACGEEAVAARPGFGAFVEEQHARAVVLDG
jgi:hypothetical protein